MSERKGEREGRRTTMRLALKLVRRASAFQGTGGKGGTQEKIDG